MACSGMTWQRDIAQVQSLMLKVDENEEGAEELLLLLLLLFASTVETNLGQLLSVSFAFFLAHFLSFYSRSSFTSNTSSARAPCMAANAPETKYQMLQVEWANPCMMPPLSHDYQTLYPCTCLINL